MKKLICVIMFLALSGWSIGFAQEAWQKHSRGLLHQSVSNYGALNTQYNSMVALYGGNDLQTPFEWPGNSFYKYGGYNMWDYNGQGGGLIMLCDTGLSTGFNHYQIHDSVVSATYASNACVDMIGCLAAQSNGAYRDGQGMYYWRGTVQRDTNYPLNIDGSWNSSYNPAEAEEIITGTVYTPYGIKITRTSREWSLPGYDSFIIYDYEFKNTGEYYKGVSGISPTHATDTISGIRVGSVEYFGPSYAYATRYLTKGWTTGFASTMLSRFDLHRYLQYVHQPDGRPDQTNYANWSANEINGGGLLAPAAVGYMLLYYDYDKLQPINQTNYLSYINYTSYEDMYCYDHGKSDPTSRYKQPWVIATTQTNIYGQKIQSHVGATNAMPYYRWNPIYTTAQDSLMLLNHLGSHAKAAYWYGRGKPNSNYNFASPMVHDYVTGPYKLAPDESFHVVYAEVAGFGPGRVKDYDKYGASLYSDYGGGNEGTINAAQDYFHPVPSWDSVITYTNAPTSISSTGGIGIAYTPTYGYPTYIRDTNVITIRDVADRCIQLYRGSPTVVKYDTAQYEPSGDKNNVTVSTNGYASSPAEIAARSGGWNAAFLNATSGSNKMAYPNPITNAVSVSTFMPGVFVKDSTVISAKITWNSAVDDVPTTIKPYVNGLKNYEIVRSTSPLGPWSTIASIIPKNASYLDGSEYKYYDYNVKIGATYYYAVISVDSTDKKNGVMTAKSLTVENVAFEKMNKVYVAPNPFFLTSGLPGESVSSPYIGFYGLTAKATIHIYSFAGQLVKVIHHDKNTTDEKWNLLNESGKKIASGVYYFTVEDLNTGNKAWNKFVVIH